jgi:hypothetical protein
VWLEDGEILSTSLTLVGKRFNMMLYKYVTLFDDITINQKYDLLSCLLTVLTAQDNYFVANLVIF